MGSSSETSQEGYSRRARRISSEWWHDGRVVDFLDGSVNLLAGKRESGAGAVWSYGVHVMESW